MGRGSGKDWFSRLLPFHAVGIVWSYYRWIKTCSIWLTFFSFYQKKVHPITEVRNLFWKKKWKSFLFGRKFEM